MARLNIDDDVWLDPRVQMLQKTIGEYEALGQLLMFWKIAQLYWGKESLVPMTVFRFHNFSEHIIGYDLAEIRPDGIYAKGAKQNFEWYRTKIENGKKGGLASGKARSNKINDLTEAKRSESEAKRSETNPPAPAPAPAPVPAPVPAPDIKKEGNKIVNLPLLFGIWGSTLKHFGITRSILASEQTLIARGVQAHGDEAVRIALIGARNEPRWENFNPREHVSLHRVFEAKKFAKFVDWGSQLRGQEIKQTIIDDPVDDFDPNSPAAIEGRKKIAEMMQNFGKMPGTNKKETDENG